MTQLRTLSTFVLLVGMAAPSACAPASPSPGTSGLPGSSGAGSGGASSSGGTIASGGSSSGGASSGSAGSSGSGASGSSGGSSGSAGSSSSADSSGSGGSSSSGGSGSGGSSSGARTGQDGGTQADGGPSSCPAGVLLCDDFESYATGTAPGGQWRTTTKGAGSAVVDTMHARSGTKAVHFSGSVNKDEAYIRASNASTPVFPVVANQIFVRFMMYVQYYPTASPMHVRFAWVGTSGVSNNMDGSGYTMCTYNGVAIERIASGYLRDTSQAMTQAANQNKWVCWEFEISNTDGPSAGGTGTVLPRIWREGTPLTLNFSGNNANWNPAPFDLVQFSLFAYQSDPMIAQYWFDDIAVSTSRIGCPP